MMCNPLGDALRRKSICLAFCVLVLVPAGNASAKLVGHWKLEEGAGTIVHDSSGNGNDGVFLGSPMWVAGKIGGALEFDGVNGYVDCGNDASISDISGTYSIEAWVKFAVATDYPGLFQRGDKTTSSQIEVYLQPAANLTTVHNRDSIFYAYWNPVALNQWTHIAIVWDKQEWKVYYNGVEQEQTGGGGTAANPGTEKTCFIGLGYTDYPMNGIIDDIRLYNHALTMDEIQFSMEGGVGYPFALSPDPADSTLHFDTWVTLSWRAGDFAVSHDVYLGDNFDNVNDGTGGTFRGNQTSTFFVAGFPGFAYPDGLVPGTTYYWRIDEVNEADPNSPWKGPVWSFSIPPKTAYDPIPLDGSKFVDPADVTLSWTAGFGAKLHTIYFGDDFDVVANATGGQPQGLITYNPGPLEVEKVYYWRVDEFDSVGTYKGDVWTFTTAKAGGGVKGEYFNNIYLDGKPVLTRIDPQIDFYWNPGPVGPGVNEDNFSVRWTGEVEAAFTEPVTFITGSDDGVRLYLDGELIIENWTGHDRREDVSEPINLVADRTYAIMMEGFESTGEAEWQLYWQSASIPRQIIPQAALSPPVRAGRPNPSNGAVDVKQVKILRWSPGEAAVSHEIYFGTDEEAVRSADTGSPEYKGTQNVGSESYDPGKLEWNTTYYWRIDEVEADGTIQKGNVWSFTTADFLHVDDFEDYTDNDAAGEAIWQSWIDGFGVADNGAQAGYLVPPYAERTIVHSGRQSMPVLYENVAGVTNSEVELTLTYPRDWTENGVSVLTIWFRGDSANAAEPLYVALDGSAVISYEDPSAAQVASWTQWNIDLQVFADRGVNLTNVDSIAIGLGTKAGITSSGGSGTVYFDDIRLWR